MKVILIVPANEYLRVTKPGKKPKGHKFFRFSMLSLLYVAACTSKDIDIELIDEHIEAVDFDESVDLVGISFMTALSSRAYEIADEFRKRGVTVVFGGFHASFMYDEALKHADAVCVGEAETTWPILINDFLKGNLQRVYKTEKRAELSQIHMPRRNLLKRKYYAPIEAVQVGRGCNHKCDFCSVTAFFKNEHHARPIEDVIEELSLIKSNRIIFVDDNIVADPAYAKKLFKAMIPLKKKWISQAGIYITDDPELVMLAKKSGCVGLFIGLETLNESNLKNMQKDFNRIEKYAASINILHQYGISVETGIVFGFDNDDNTVFEKTLKFLLKNNVDAVQVSILTPLPGTPLYDAFKGQGRIVDDDWARYDYRHAIIAPKLMSSKELQAGADWVINRFYSPWNIFKRIIRNIFYIGITNSLTFSLGLNSAYYADVLLCKIRGYNPANLHVQRRYLYNKKWRVTDCQNAFNLGKI